MKNVQKTITEYMAERNWQELHPADLAKSVSIESSERLELFQWGRQTKQEIVENDDLIQNIKDEIADVMIYCIEMGVVLDFDIKPPLNITINYLNFMEK